MKPETPPPAYDSQSAKHGEPSMPVARKRILLLFLVLALVAMAAVGGWFAASLIESPAEVAARTAPPAPSPILVPVERRTLSSTIVTRGTARFGLPHPISIAPSVLKPNPGLITALPVRNRQIREAQLGVPILLEHLKVWIQGLREQISDRYRLAATEDAALEFFPFLTHLINRCSG